MTLLQISERLKQEFPDRELSFTMSVWHHGQIGCPPTVQLQLWDAALHQHIDCVSLEDGISKLRLALQPSTQPAAALDVEVEPRLEAPYVPWQVCCRLCGATVPLSQARKHACEHDPEMKVQAEDIVLGKFIMLREVVHG